VIKDKPKIITAVTITTRRFGPSGSLKSVNMILENAVAVKARITSDDVFDMKCI
jgi:hypothetical protein